MDEKNKKEWCVEVVYQLIYASSAAEGLDDFSMREIAQTSNYNNKKLGVTGLLLFHQGSILQVLEGDEISVNTLYNKVQYDKRHNGCIILSTRTAERREFANWSMGYKNVSEKESGDALFALTQASLKAILPDSPSDELDALTKTYQRVSGF